MKFTGLLFFICFIFCDASCGSFCASDSRRLVIDRVFNKTIKIVQKNSKIKAIGTGLSSPGGAIQKFILSFQSRKPYTKEELRWWLIEIANTMLEQINNDPELQQYLVKSRFSIENVQIRIFNYDLDGEDVFDPEISVAKLSDGVIEYITRDPADRYKYKNEEKETYEAALQRLREDHSK